MAAAAGYAGRRRDNIWRATAELVGALVIGGALLATPFVYFAVRLNARQVNLSPVQVARIDGANCAQLREQFHQNRAAAGDDTSLGFSGEIAEIERRIVRRSERLDCQPAAAPRLMPAVVTDRER
jgi:hypothetical protein